MSDEAAARQRDVSHVEHRAAEAYPLDTLAVATWASALYVRRIALDLQQHLIEQCRKSPEYLEARKSSRSASPSEFGRAEKLGRNLDLRDLSIVVVVTH